MSSPKNAEVLSRANMAVASQLKTRPAADDYAQIFSITRNNRIMTTPLAARTFEQMLVRKCISYTAMKGQKNSFG